MAEGRGFGMAIAASVLDRAFVGGAGMIGSVKAVQARACATLSTPAEMTGGNF